MKNKIISFLLIFLFVGNISYGVADGDFDKAVENLVKNNILKDNKIDRDSKLTRGEVLDILKNIERIDKKFELKKDKVKKFSDVKDNYIYKEGIDWASSGNVVSGVGSGLFKPDRNITREEFGVIVYNYLMNSNLNLVFIEPWQIFEDENDISSWASSKINLLCVNKLLDCDGKNFYPKGEVSMEEFILVLDKVINAGMK